MGMYTGLWGTVKLKPECADEIVKLTAGEDSKSWAELELPEKVRNDRRFQHFVADDRCGSIPRGNVDLNPGNTELPKDKFSTVEGNVWTFACGFKNYDQVLDKFLAMLPLIADDWNLESIYCESVWDMEPDTHARHKMAGMSINVTTIGRPTDDDQHCGYGGG